MSIAIIADNSVAVRHFLDVLGSSGSAKNRGPGSFISNKSDRIEVRSIVGEYNFFDVLTMWNGPVYGRSSIVTICSSIVNLVAVFEAHLKVIGIG